MKKVILIIILCIPASAQMPMQKPVQGVPVNFGSNLSGDIVGLWLLNEGAGGMVYDLSGNENHGMFEGGSTWTSGRSGPAVDFDGIDGAINCGNKPSLNVGPVFTVSFWVVLRTTGDDRVMVGHRTVGTTSAGWMFYQFGANNLAFFVYNYATDFTWHTPLPLNEWAHVVGVSTATDTILYRDGQLEGSAAKGGGAYVVPTDDVYMAHNANSGALDYTDCVIGQCKIWNRALTAADVASLYRNPVQMFDQPRLPIASAAGPAEQGQLIMFMSKVPDLMIVGFIITVIVLVISRISGVENA